MDETLPCRFNAWLIPLYAAAKVVRAVCGDTWARDIGVQPSSASEDS
jgi:hypothetical protein